MLLFAAIATVLGLSRSPQTDWQRFDHRTFTVSNVDSGDLFQINAVDAHTLVHPLGIQAPPLVDPSTNRPGHGGVASYNYFRARLQQRSVTLRLDALQTRDAEGALLAYVYLTDTDCLNADAIHDGMAYADRRTTHAYHAQYEQAENDARKKQRGLWKGLTENDMPAWRRAWLHSLVKDLQ